MDAAFEATKKALAQKFPETTEEKSRKVKKDDPNKGTLVMTHTGGKLSGAQVRAVGPKSRSATARLRTIPRPPCCHLTHFAFLSITLYALSPFQHDELSALVGIEGVKITSKVRVFAAFAAAHRSRQLTAPAFRRPVALLMLFVFGTYF